VKSVDREALKRAMALAAEDPMRADQLRDQLQSRPWAKVAQFAAHLCQSKSLHLKPWERPPLSYDVRDQNPGAVLLRRLLAAKLSRFEPDPAAALNAVGTPAA
jgi:hypothetical protein